MTKDKVCLWLTSRSDGSVNGISIRSWLSRSLGLGSFSLLESLLLEERWLGEAEGNSVGGKLVVAVSDGSELVIHDLLIEWVKVHLLGFLTIDINSHTSASDVGWEALQYKIIIRLV